MSTIYCVEDDSNIRELIEYTLSSAGFEVTSCESGTVFFEKLKENHPDAILLDIMLPDTDGMEILKKLRMNKDYDGTGIIMLTAKSERMDKIRGLDTGADDYITKPFDVLELISRVKAVLRRSSPHNIPSELVWKDIRLDHNKRIVYVNDNVVTLTYKEYELLYKLLSAKGNVITRESLVSEIWGTDFEGESRTLDVHIRTLRQKLGEAGNYIDTVRNVGYKIG